MTEKIVRLYNVRLSFNDRVEAKNAREAISKVRKKLSRNSLFAETELIFEVGDTTYSGYTLSTLKKELARKEAEKHEEKVKRGTK